MGMGSFVGCPAEAATAIVVRRVQFLLRKGRGYYACVDRFSEL